MRFNNRYINESIPKLFMKMEAVRKEIERYETARKKLVIPYAKEIDPIKKEKLIKPLRKLTDKINKLKLNLKSMEDMENSHTSNMNVFRHMSSKVARRAKKDMKGEFGESIDESNAEPQVIRNLRWVVKKKKSKKLGKELIEPSIAKLILKVYKALSKKNKEKYITKSVSVMGTMAHKILKI